MKVGSLFFHQVGQIWSYRAVIFFPCSKSRDLDPEHGFKACPFKNKGKKLDFHIFGGKKTNKIRETLNEIGQMLVSRALDRTKKMRKTAADIFANSGPGKRLKKKKLKKISRLFPDFPVASRLWPGLGGAREA